MDGFYFSMPVRRTLAVAREEAARLNHEYVATEHMLLALTRNKDTIAFATLERCGVETGGLADRIDEIVKRGEVSSAPRTYLPYTSRAKKVLELAMEEA